MDFDKTMNFTVERDKNMKKCYGNGIVRRFPVVC